MAEKNVLTSDPFLLRVLDEPLPGVPVAIDVSESFEMAAPYCSFGTCTLEASCVSVTLEDGSRWFQLREFAEWMRRYDDKYGDPVDDDGWEPEESHWCHAHSRRTDRG